MPEKQTVNRAKHDLRSGKSASTAAGEFVHEEIEHIRHGKHGAKSTKQAIAIGLSKARRAGVPLKRPKSGTVSKSTERSIKSDTKAAHSKAKRPSAKRSRASLKRLKRASKSVASKAALSRHARSVAKRKRTKKS